jgi:hypothetical protein
MNSTSSMADDLRGHYSTGQQHLQGQQQLCQQETKKRFKTIHLDDAAVV